MNSYVLNTHILSLRKLFADSLLTPQEEPVSSSSPPPAQDLKFLTYSATTEDSDMLLSTANERLSNTDQSQLLSASGDSDMSMRSSILALAAESSGISLERDLEEELLSTPPRTEFGVDLDF